MLITRIRKLTDKSGFQFLALVGIIPAFIIFVYFVSWPWRSYHAGARWIGEVFWIVLLLVTAIVILIAVVRVGEAQERHPQVPEIAPDASSVDSEADRLSFANEVSSCLNDHSIAGYFKRNLVRQDHVTKALVDGDAFRRSREIDEYAKLAQARSKVGNVTYESSMIGYHAFDLRVAVTFISMLALSVLLFVEIGSSSTATSGMAFTSTFFVGVSTLFFAAAWSEPEHRLRKLVFPLLAGCLALCVIILPPVLVDVEWNSLAVMFPIWISSLVLCYIVATGETAQQCLNLLTVGVARGYLLFLKADELELQRKWLDSCEDIIKEHANLTINTILGKDKDLFLVEQDSEGLRRLQDPSYTVSTRSEHRIESVLSQMDAASIALAGPRGAGKSTLLRKFSGPQRSSVDDDPGISLYLAAPAEYIPRDFIAALFQQLCEAYLLHEQCALPGSMFKEPPKINFGHAFRRFFKLLRLFLRTVIPVAVIAWLMRSFIGTHYHHMYESIITPFRDWYDQVNQYVHKNVYKQVRPYWTWIRILMLIAAVLSLLSTSPRWKRYFKPHREPVLAKSAREYLRRLQIENSVTWGRGASLGLPSMRGVTLSLNRGGTAKYVPWTFPELVAHTRRFMQGISEQFKYSSHAVIVGIDEIDRIGSLEHAEKFVGEIKAIFGVERCFFLVAVAEDVGSIFAQRATVGRSILENAFDDIVLVEPLDFKETRDLLLKRVPGFTDSFVYLVHALSGGLPRELIRITRRLVDTNQEASTAERQPRLQDLAFCLVKEELIEAIRATRNQMARLALHPNWTIFFEKLHEAGISLGNASPFLASESYALIKELSELSVLGAPGEEASNRELVKKDEDEAGRIVKDFTAFSFFGMTIIDAFSDKYFDLEAVQSATAIGSEGSYEKLAAARGELTISPENSRAMLRRFHGSLSSRANG